MKSLQSSLEATLVKVITAPEPYPTPGRAIRNLAARCFVNLYTRGESRALFDTLQAFMKVVAYFKTPDKDLNKMYVLGLCAQIKLFMPGHSAAFYCVGELMAIFGAQVSISSKRLILCLNGSWPVHVLYGGDCDFGSENVQIIKCSMYRLKCISYQILTSRAVCNIAIQCTCSFKEISVNSQKSCH